MIKIKLVEQKEPVKLDLNLIVDTIKEYDPSINIVSIYHYGSSFTGEYGKTHKDTYGDIDIGVVVDKPLDEDDWYKGEQYEFLSTENYDVSLTHDDSEIWEPRKLIYGKQLTEQVINERTSNKLYNNIFAFFDRYMFNFDYLEEPKFSIQHRMFYDKGGYFPCPVYVTSIDASKFPTQKEEIELYETYKRITGDTTIIKDRNELSFIMADFTIVFAPKGVVQGAGADMSNDGTLRIYVNDWYYEKDINAARNPALEQMAPTKDEIKKIFKYKNQNFRMLLRHELYHYINALRSGKKGFRSKGGMKQFDSSTKEYSNSTEEIQARIAEYSELIEFIIQIPYQDIPPAEHQIAYHLALGNKNKFIRSFFYNIIFSNDYKWGHHKKYWVEYTIQNKRRIINRLAGLFDDYTGDRGVLGDILDNYRMSKVKYLPRSYPDIDMNSTELKFNIASLPVDRESLPKEMQNRFAKSDLNARLSLQRFNQGKVDVPVLEGSKDIFKWWNEVIKRD
jgi:predicted nucleotidyltransferase